MIKEVKFTGLELEKLQALIREFQYMENDLLVWAFDDLEGFFTIAKDIIFILEDKVMEA